MILFNPPMETEKLAVIGLVIILVCGLSFYIITTEDFDIFSSDSTNNDSDIEIVYSSFIMRSNISENHTFSVSYYTSMHFKAISVNDTTAVFAMNAIAPDIKFVDQTLVFDLEITKLYIHDVAQIGSCADVNYTGKFQVNDTIFDTSNEQLAIQEGLYNEQRTYEPLKIFIDPNGNLTVPEGYENYSSTMIAGFLNGLIGMVEGETKTVILPPEEAYGTWNTSLAELYGMDNYPLDSVVNTTIEQSIEEFQYSFPDVTVERGTTFDYGAIALETENVIMAKILKVTDNALIYQLIPEDGATFTLPLFNWEVTLIVEE